MAVNNVVIIVLRGSLNHQDCYIVKKGVGLLARRGEGKSENQVRAIMPV
jgi:hypothetical protein